MAELELAKLFQGLNPDELQNLRRIAQDRRFAAGQEIFREGNPGDGIYVIQEGLVEIAHLVDLKEHRVFSRLGPGEVFGEMAVIENLPRSATAIAAKDTRVHFVPRDEMLALIKHSPGLAFNLLQEISRRLRDFNQLHLREIIQAERLAVVGNFARSIIHDLKNPLTVISLAVELLGQSLTTPEQRDRSLEHIRRQAQHISEMIGDILEFTQSASAETVFASAEFRQFVNGLLPELVADAAVKAVSIELRNEPPAVQLLLDVRRVRRVFFNLLHNAMDVMPDGGKIFLRFQLDEKEVVTEVEDTGPGVASEVADRLFQPFTTHGKTHGTGLGLCICKKIVEDHGGRIWMRHESGHGAIFSFALPIREA